MFGIGTVQLLILGIVAVILFGSRLPAVARSLGQSLVEFKKGMRDLENDVRSSVYTEPPNRVSYHDSSEPSATPPEPTATSD